MSDEEKNRAESNEKEEKDNYRDDEDDKDDETRAAEDKAAKEAARKRCYKFADPPKTYSDVKVRDFALNPEPNLLKPTRSLTNSNTLYHLESFMNAARGCTEGPSSTCGLAYQRTGDRLHVRVERLCH
jgi:hypothetical protein